MQMIWIKTRTKNLDICSRLREPWQDYGPRVKPTAEKAFAQLKRNAARSVFYINTEKIIGDRLGDHPGGHDPDDRHDVYRHLGGRDRARARCDNAEHRPDDTSCH